MDRQELNLLFKYLESNPKHLTLLQYKFITSLKENYKLTGFLRKREVERLHEIKEYIPSAISEEAETVYGTDTDKYQAQYSSFDYGTSYNGPF